MPLTIDLMRERLGEEPETTEAPPTADATDAALVEPTPAAPGPEDRAEPRPSLVPARLGPDGELLDPTSERRRIGPMLVQLGFVSEGELKDAIRVAQQTRTTVLDVLMKSGAITEDQLATCYERALGLPRASLFENEIAAEALEIVSEEIARRYTCVPLHTERRFLDLAMEDPLNYAAVQEIEFLTGMTVRTHVATRTEVTQAIKASYRLDDHLETLLSASLAEIGLSADGESTDEIDLDAGAGAGAGKANAHSKPVVKLCNGILQRALQSEASDLHIEPEDKTVHVRIRVDGIMRDLVELPKWIQLPLAARLKVLAELDIAEKRRPQDGRIRIQHRGEQVDLRVSTLPTHAGEKVVLRFLGTAKIPSFQAMGLDEAQASTVESAVFQPQGMILVTGPTGSGKSTSLYSMVTRRKSLGENIVTVEDPIEYRLPGVNQVQVNEKAGLTFAKALRSILRQDPDVVLVGEIRDHDTAEIAFRAAMTGHLVLSTLHTNSAAATLLRLMDIGVEPMQIASSIHLIVAQRLVRRVCPACREPYTPAADVLKKLDLGREVMTFYRGRGCRSCGMTGYAERVGVFELLPMTRALKDAITRRASESEIERIARSGGARFLREDAIQKIRDGVTNPDEVARVISFELDARSPCPHCSKPIDAQFAACPYCKRSVKDLCQGCNAPMEPDWAMCPHCKTAREGTSLARLQTLLTGEATREDDDPSPAPTPPAAAEPEPSVVHEAAPAPHGTDVADGISPSLAAFEALARRVEALEALLAGDRGGASAGPPETPVGEEVLRTVLAGLDAEGAEARTAAVESLHELGSGCVEGLCRLLESDDESDRAGAALALAEVGPSARHAIEGLVGALRRPSSTVRTRAAAALGRMGSEARRAAPALQEMCVRDPHGPARAHAALALATIGARSAIVASTLAEALELDDESIRHAAARTLGELDALAASAIPALAAALSDASWPVRRSAAWSLAQLGPCASEAAPQLRRATRDSQWGVRKSAVWALAQVAPEESRSLEAIEAALGDAEADVRFWAVRALDQAAPPSSAFRSSMVALLEDPDAQVRACVARCAPRLEGDGARGIAGLLTTALEDGDAVVREAAAQSLGRVVDECERANHALAGALADESGDVRFAAARALRRRSAGGDEIVRMLQKAARDEHAAVRQEATLALDELCRG